MLMGFLTIKKEFGIMIATADKIIIYLVLNDFKKDEIIIAYYNIIYNKQNSKCQN